MNAPFQPNRAHEKFLETADAMSAQQAMVMHCAQIPHFPHSQRQVTAAAQQLVALTVEFAGQVAEAQQWKESLIHERRTRVYEAGTSVAVRKKLQEELQLAATVTVAQINLDCRTAWEATVYYLRALSVVAKELVNATGHNLLAPSGATYTSAALRDVAVNAAKHAAQYARIAVDGVCPCR